MDASAAAIDSVNTIVNDDGVLTAYNTDYIAIAQLIERNAIDPASSVLLRGSGGMAKATAAAFRDAGFSRVTVVARNEKPRPIPGGALRLRLAGRGRGVDSGRASSTSRRSAWPAVR